MGSFVCESNQTQIEIVFQGFSISVNPITISGDLYPFDCSCPSCTQNFTFNSQKFPFGIPNYDYGAMNQLFISIIEGSLCLSYMVIDFYYEISSNKVIEINPSSGPIQGGTIISVIGENFIQTDEFNCYINGAKVEAIYVDSQNLICNITLKINIQKGPGYLQILDNGFPITDFILFYFYSEPKIESFFPIEGVSGQNITIFGTDLIVISNSISHIHYSCKFGSVLSKYIPINSRYAICVVPQGISKGSTKLEISFNGQQWTKADSIFSVVVIDKNWTDMPYILYVILILVVGSGILIGILIISLILIKKSKKATMEATPLLSKNINSSEFDFEKLDISQIEIVKKIGKGSFGEVYLGHYLGTNVAIKKLPTNRITKEFFKEFVDEANLMKSLRHPNVIQFLSANLEEPNLSIITEYMPLGSLYHLIHDPNVIITQEMIRKIALDTSKGMAYLHHRNPAIIHRDLKSHNLLVDENWKVKVCDFGLSRIAAEGKDLMTACGTPCWTAPEVLRNSNYTTKADVYSFSIVLWELVTRQDPYPGMSPFQVIFIVGSKCQRLTIPNSCHIKLKNLIEICWSEDPQSRPSFNEIISYLEGLESEFK